MESLKFYSTCAVTHVCICLSSLPEQWKWYTVPTHLILFHLLTHLPCANMCHLRLLESKEEVKGNEAVGCHTFNFLGHHLQH